MQHIDGWWCPEVLSGPGKFLRRSAVIPYALQHWHGEKRCVVQAGAHIGVWPRMLAQYFERVVCFEPEPANWECLRCNTTGSSRIQCVHAMLGATEGVGILNVQPHSTGGHHAATRLDRPTVQVPRQQLDSYALSDVGAIFFDIEGYELPALIGARQTLARCMPLLVLEENGCSRKYGIPTGWVGWWLRRRFGYRQVATYGEDVVFVAGEQ